MNLYKYAKSFIVSEPVKTYWTSGFIFFTVNKQVILDKAFIIIGNIPVGHYSYYCNFSNWQVVDDKLYHITSNGRILVDPSKVHLHLKYNFTTDITFDFMDDVINNTNHINWNLFVSHPNSKIFKSVRDQLLNLQKLKVIDLRDSKKFTSSNSSTTSFVTSSISSYTIKKLSHPLFETTQYYGNGINAVDQAICSHLNISLL